jgi:hypothetical protein
MANGSVIVSETLFLYRIFAAMSEYMCVVEGTYKRNLQIFSMNSLYP